MEEVDTLSWAPYGYWRRGNTTIFNEGPFACSDCQTLYPAIGALKEHLASDHIEYAPYGCIFDGCDVRRYSREKLEQHIRAKRHGPTTNFFYLENEAKRQELDALVSEVCNNGHTDILSTNATIDQSSVEIDNSWFIDAPTLVRQDTSPVFVSPIGKRLLKCEAGGLTQTIKTFDSKLPTPQKVAKRDFDGIESFEMTHGGIEVAVLPDRVLDEHCTVTSSTAQCPLNNVGDSSTTNTEQLVILPWSEQAIECVTSNRMKGAMAVEAPTAYQSLYCLICKRFISYKRATRSHVWSHLGQPMFRCCLCPDLTVTSISCQRGVIKRLQQHVCEKHGIAPTDEQLKTSGICWEDTRPNHARDILTVIRRCYGESLPDKVMRTHVVFGSENVNKVEAEWAQLLNRKCTTNDTKDDKQPPRSKKKTKAKNVAPTSDVMSS